MLSRAQAFAASTDLRNKMRQLGIVDKPDVYFLKN